MTTATKPMTRTEFFEKLPWVLELPAQPKCSECLIDSLYKHKKTGSKTQLILIEYHNDNCSRAKFDGTETTIT